MHICVCIHTHTHTHTYISGGRNHYFKIHQKGLSFYFYTAIFLACGLPNELNSSLAINLFCLLCAWHLSKPWEKKPQHEHHRILIWTYYLSAALNIPANLENSAVATGLEKVCFHSNPKERQCQRMLKLPHNCTHLTC